MIFQKKVDRAFKWLKDKNTNMDNKDNSEDAKGNTEEDIEDINLEKKDYLAMFISSILVFAPIFIILIIIAIWAFL